MNNSKVLQFKGSPGGFFVLTIVSAICMYVPLFGWAFLLNYNANYFADNILVNGKTISFNAGYGEALKLVFINALLMLITLGIWTFWFYPRVYRYVADHISYADSAGPFSPASPAANTMPPVATPTVQPPASPGATSQSPVSPTRPIQ